MTSAYNSLNKKQVNDLSIGLCPICNARLTAECEHRTQESEEWLAAYIVAELEIHNERRPFDRDDAAILQAARAIFPNAVLVGDMVRAEYGLGQENLGTRFTISGSEVMEIDSHLEAGYEERTEEDMPF